MTHKTLVIDCQVLQGAAWDRGMGKYTFKLLYALHKEYKGRVVLLFNTNLPENPDMKQSIAADMPNFKVYNTTLLIPGNVKKVASLQKDNTQLLDDAIEQLGLNAQETAFFIPCLFLWPACAVFPTNTVNVLLMHDIIPLLYFDQYFPNMRVEDYLSQYRILIEADHVVTVSKSVRNDLQVFLGLEGSRITPINGAAVIDVAPKKINSLGDIKKPFVLMPTGNDLRKNNQRAAAAFEKFLEDSGKKFELVITSFFTDFEKQELQRISPNIRFTNNVSDDELAWLYKNCECVLFVSESEGLGLPMLEAVAYNRPAVCSDIPVFREISRMGVYYANPYNPETIRQELARALTSGLTKPMQEEYKRVKSQFTWAGVAKNLTNVVESLKPTDRQQKKPRIAILGPTPSGYAGPGKMLGEMHPALSREFDIDYYLETSFVDDRQVRPNYLRHVAPCFSVRQFNAAKYRQYDAVIYHMGNSENHLIIAQHALALPGIMIVHDTHLPNVYRFLRDEGVMDPKRVEIEERLNKLIKDDLSSYTTTLMNSQLGLMTHSEFAQTAVQATLENKVTMVRANLPYQNPDYDAQDRERAQFHVGIAGMLANVKGLAVLEQLAADSRFKNCIFDVFGFNFAEEGALERLEQYTNIRVSPNLTDQEYQARLANLDVVLNFRTEYRGESSSVTLEAMRYGIVAIVRNVGWYAELPDNCAVKVEKLQDIADELLDLLANKKRRNAIGAACKQFIDTKILHERYVEKIKEIITKVDDPSLSQFALAKAIKKGESLERLVEYVQD